MEWNAESVLDALNDFERKSEIPEILDQYLERIAKNGEIVFPWNKLKPLLKKKLEFVLDEFYETFPVETSNPVPNFETFNFDNLKKTILTAVDAFTSAPFTIQRLCELVTNPTKHYNRTDKYMRGIEKNVLVVSTIEPRSETLDGVNANNPIVNGMPSDSPRDDNDALNGHESSGVSFSNLNTPSNHVLLENFANVFPSAVCIPPSTDICEDADVDTNFMENAEPELAPVESVEEAVVDEAKEDEDMDTTEDNQFESIQQQSDAIAKEEPVAEDIETAQTTDSESAVDVTEMESIEESPLELPPEAPETTVPQSEPIDQSKPTEKDISTADNPDSDEVPSSTKPQSPNISIEETQEPEENLPSQSPSFTVEEPEEVPPVKETQDSIEAPTVVESQEPTETVSPNYIGEVASVIDKLDDFINKASDVVVEEVTEPTELSMDSESSTSSNDPELPV